MAKKASNKNLIIAGVVGAVVIVGFLAFALWFWSDDQIEQRLYYACDRSDSEYFVKQDLADRAKSSDNTLAKVGGFLGGAITERDATQECRNYEHWKKRRGIK